MPCDRCAEHQIHINQLLERAALTEDLHIKEMDTLRERLRAMQEENREREAECEGLKRERDDLLKKLEGHQLQPSVTTSVLCYDEFAYNNCRYKIHTLNYIQAVTLLRGWLSVD